MSDEPLQDLEKEARRAGEGLENIGRRAGRDLGQGVEDLTGLEGTKDVLGEFGSLVGRFPFDPVGTTASVGRRLFEQGPASTTGKGPTPELPSRALTIPEILRQRLQVLEKQRSSQTLLTGGTGVGATPLASTVLFGT